MDVVGLSTPPLSVSDQLVFLSLFSSHPPLPSRSHHTPPNTAASLCTMGTTPPPQKTQSDLEFFRLRMKNNREILAAPGPKSLVIVVQSWKATGVVEVHPPSK